ncbi:MAG: PAS domain S-box protein [Caulobacterales bacterium]
MQAIVVQLERFFDVSLDMLCIRDRDGRFVKVNKAWEASLGYRPEELEGVMLLTLVHPDDVVATRRRMEGIHDGDDGVVNAFVNRYRRRDGSYRHLEWRARNVDDVVYGVARDVTDRIAAETEQRALTQALEREKARLAAVQAVAKIGGWETDLSTFEVQWSEEAYRIFGQTPEAFRPSHEGFLALVHPDDRDAVSEAFAKSLSSTAAARIQHRILLPNGRVRDVEERWQSFADEAGRIVRAVGTCQDITERHEALKKSQMALQTALSATEAILDNSYDIICTLGEDGRFIKVNSRVEQVWGYTPDEMVGQAYACMIHPDDRKASLELAAQIIAGTPVGGHMNRCLRKDGEPVPMMWSARWSRTHRMIFAVARDMSEHILAEDRLRQAQKLEAVGRLTGGVAHDFNNLLTVITGSVEALTDGLADRPDLQALGRLALDSADKGAELVAGLLAFSRNQPLAPQPVDCNAILDEMREIVRRTFAEDIEMELEKAPGDLRCLADRTQLITALLNLCMNARDAMPYGGRLTLRAARRQLAEHGRRDGAESGAWHAVFTVEDTGRGMSDKIKERATEPFFTTKMVGQGAGLGLSMVYGFVNQSGGRLHIDSELDRGARVSLFLPQTQNEVVARLPAEAAAASPITGHILLVEDDDLVRSQVERQLRALGHTVTSAPDGVAALRLISESRSFDLLVTDVVMPKGLNGRELAERVRTLSPRTRVLLTSGHDQASLQRGGGASAGDDFLPKPYRRAQLQLKVAGLLSRTT